VWRHRRLALPGLLASLVVLAGLAQAASAPTPAQPDRAPRVVLQEGFAPPIRPYLTRLSPATLAPLGPTQVEPINYWPVTLSPGQRSVLLVKVHRSGSPVAAVRVVDLPALDAERAIHLGAGTLLDAAWPSARSVLALVSSGPVISPDCCEVRLVEVDPASGRVSATQPALENATLVVDAAYRDGFVILAAPPTGSAGSAQLVIASISAPLRSIPLDRIQATQGPVGGVPSQTQPDQRPGLALDAQDDVAYVVGTDGLVARVDLQSGSVSYQQPSGASAPPTSLQAITAQVRDAAWLAGGRIVVSGYDVDSSADPSEGSNLEPAGTSIIDTTTWQQTTLGAADDAVAVDGQVIISYHAYPYPGAISGIHAYTSDGQPLYSALGGHPIQNVESLGPRLVVYTGVQRQQRWLLDARSGRVLSHQLTGPKTFSLLVGPSLITG
jgi:hypothetical protein